MRHEALAKLIDTRVKTLWGSTYPITPENVKFSEPAKDLWVRYSIRPTTGTMAEIGGSMKRNAGLLWFSIFTPEADGVRVAAAVGDHVDALFSLQTISLPGIANEQVKFRESEFGYVGQESSGRLHHRAIVPYELDSFR